MESAWSLVELLSTSRRRIPVHNGEGRARRSPNSSTGLSLLPGGLRLTRMRQFVVTVWRLLSGCFGTLLGIGLAALQSTWVLVQFQELKSEVSLVAFTLLGIGITRK